MKTYSVYILLCRDGSYYTGMTANLDQRIAQHQDGINKTAYTFSRRPVLLKWYVSFTDPQQAILWEKRIKGWSRRKKKSLIDGNWEDLALFSKNYTQYGNKIDKK